MRLQKINGVAGESVAIIIDELILIDVNENRLV